MDAPKGAHLMGPNEEGSLNIVTLLLTGRATPYLHNGVVYVGDEDHYALPQFGILSRAAVGLLVLGTDAELAKMVCFDYTKIPNDIYIFCVFKASISTTWVTS